MSGTRSIRLPIARYRFECTLEGELRLPEYSGSLLRGVFGAALRRTACMTRLPQCAGCPLRQTCPYPAIFETPPRESRFGQRFSAMPNPYVIEPPPLGERRAGPQQPLTFAMVLIGWETLRQLPLIVHAWQRALAHGLGSQRTRGRLASVRWLDGPGCVDEPVLDHETGRISPHDPGLAFDCSPVRCDGVTLHISTPLRLQHNGKAIPPAALSPRVLLATLLRRIGLLLEGEAELADLSRDAPSLVALTEPLLDDRTRLRWTDWTRYSSRQQQEMTLGGVTGAWSLSGPLDALMPWLQLGQWVHVGKNATMGMGHYSLEAVE